MFDVIMQILLLQEKQTNDFEKYSCMNPIRN